MAARALRLRWQLFLSGNNGGVGSRLWRLTLAGLLLFTFFAAAWVPNAGIVFSKERAAALDSFLLLVITVAFFIVALFRSEKVLGVRQFAHFPISAVNLRNSLLLSSTASPLGLALLVYALTRVFTRGLLGERSLGFELLGALALIITCHLLLQLGGALGQLVFATGLPAAVSKWLGYLLLAALLPLAIYIAAEILTGDFNLTAATLAWMGYTPLGFPYGAAALLAHGITVQLGIAIGGLLLWWALLFSAYVAVTNRLQNSIEHTLPGQQANNSLGVFDHFSDTPAGVIAARTVIYWRRDPRYFVSLLALPVAAILITFAMFIAGMGYESLALLPVPIMLYLLGWSIHNDIAMDSTAIWMHVASNTRGRDDRVGRLAPILIVGLPLLIIGTTVSVLLVGKWYIFPAVLGLNAALLLIGAGVSTVASAWVVYPSTRPGESPFLQPQYLGGGATAAQAISFIGGVVLALPAIITAIIALVGSASFIANFVALTVGMLSGVGVLWCCIWLGGIIFDRTAPEIVGTTEVFD